MIAILFPDFWELELLFLKDERNLGIFSEFDLGIRFLSTRSKHSISHGRISVPSLGWLPSISRADRPFIYSRGLVSLVVSRRRSASLRMRSVAREELRNIGKWFWKVRLCARWSSTMLGAVQAEIALINAKNRRDENLVSYSPRFKRSLSRQLITIDRFQSKIDHFCQTLERLRWLKFKILILQNRTCD